MPPFRRRNRRHVPDWVPEPPVELPSGCVHQIAGRGELFVRDTGGDGPPVLLLHGWTASADVNWWPTYGALSRAGYRAIALDHRGHGRGLRTDKSFRLEDCAHDAAALVEHLGLRRVTAVGYSMGGPVAQLLARDHPELLGGLVLCATAQDWQDAYLKVFWRTMAFFRLGLGVFPLGWWDASLRLAGIRPSPQRTWLAAELSRGASVDLAEAGRELGRYDARPWIGSLRTPAAVVLTTRDQAVLPRKQRQLARALRAPAFAVSGDHFAVSLRQDRFNAALIAALRAVGAQPAATGSGTRSASAA